MRHFPKFATTHVKMYAYNEAGIAEHDTAKTDDGYAIGMFITRWLQTGCKEIKLIPDDQKGGDESA